MLDEKEIKKARQKANRRLAKIRRMSDQEAAHSDADDVLVDLLLDLGFDDVVAEYNRIEKWYA